MPVEPTPAEPTHGDAFLLEVAKADHLVFRLLWDAMTTLDALRPSGHRRVMPVGNNHYEAELSVNELHRLRGRLHRIVDEAVKEHQ